MFKHMFIVIALFTVFPLTSVFANSDCSMTIKHPLVDTPKHQLIFSLLKLSLSKVSTSVCYDEFNQFTTDARASKMIEEGLLDVHWGGANSFANSLLVPIKTPIFKGLLGYRIFVINQGDQHKFDNVHTLNDLKKLVAGQGKFWGDTKVLKHAGIPLVTTIQGKQLWRMLKSRRFDYLPLAVHEPWEELELIPEYNLTVEKNLMLVYPMALFYYVKKQDTFLYSQIKNGMEKAINDGSYNNMLKASQMMQSAAKFSNFAKRKIIYINNPNISENFDYKKQTDELIRLIAVK